MSSGTVHAGVRMAHLLLSQEAVQKDPDQNIRVIQSMMLRTSSGGAVAATSFQDAHLEYVLTTHSPCLHNRYRLLREKLIRFCKALFSRGFQVQIAVSTHSASESKWNLCLPARDSTRRDR